MALHVGMNAWDCLVYIPSFVGCVYYAVRRNCSDVLGRDVVIVLVAIMGCGKSWRTEILVALLLLLLFSPLMLMSAARWLLHGGGLTHWLVLVAFYNILKANLQGARLYWMETAASSSSSSRDTYSSRVLPVFCSSSAVTSACISNEYLTSL